jgi:hypothetical protein
MAEGTHLMDPKLQDLLADFHRSPEKGEQEVKRLMGEAAKRLDTIDARIEDVTDTLDRRSKDCPGPKKLFLRSPLCQSPLLAQKP